MNFFYTHQPEPLLATLWFQNYYVLVKEYANSDSLSRANNHYYALSDALKAH